MSEKMNVCPYCFQKMNKEDLAYELVFFKGFDITSLDETVLYGEKIIRKGADKGLSRRFGDESSHFLLYSSHTDKKGNGLKRLIKMIEEKNAETRAERASQNDDDDDDDDDSRIMLAYEENRDVSEYIFAYATESGRGPDRIMKAVPCCPHCHARLPKGWFEADDFCPVAFVAPSGGGKTVILLSMLAKELYNLGIAQKELCFFPVQDQYSDSRYGEFYKVADYMIDEGTCPINTDISHYIAPVFLGVKYKEHSMIIGLYDCSGEGLVEMNDMDLRTAYIPQMFGYIYLIEPKQMNIVLPDKNEKIKKTLMTLEEQGTFQLDNTGNRKSGEELLQGTAVVKKPRYINQTFQLYNRLINYLNTSGRLEKQHIAYSVVKCDLLEELEEFKQLLYEGENVDSFDVDWINTREEVIKVIFERYILGRDYSIANLEREWDSSSWHLISALGCDPYEDVNEKGEPIMRFDPLDYRPIRVAEPLITCIRKKLSENEWL